MGYGYNFDSSGSLPIDHMEGKAPHEVMLCASNVSGPLAGVFSDSIDGKIEFNQKSVSSRGASLSVPSGCRLCFSDGCGMDIYLPG